MVSIGSSSPSWSVDAYHNGEFTHLSNEDFLGHWVLIYWWPFDATAICHSEVVGFQSLEAEFADLGVTLLGVSCNTTESHKDWFTDVDAFPNGSPKHPALSDETRQMTKDFGFYFPPANCSVRGTVLINPEGIVQSMAANFLSVARDPQDALVTTRAFVRGESCTVSDR